MLKDLPIISSLGVDGSSKVSIAVGVLCKLKERSYMFGQCCALYSGQ